MKITRLYDYFSCHKGVRRLSIIAFSALMVFFLSSLNFSEDISDFLPLGTKEREEMSVFQEISGAGQIIVIFSNPGNPDRTVEAIDAFVKKVKESDEKGWCRNLSARIDMDVISDVSDFLYNNIPYFLTNKDFERMDSLLSTAGYTSKALEKDHNMLLFPSSPLVTKSIANDPLDLFSPVLSRLRTSIDRTGFELYDNCIFTKDLSMAIIMMESPFGSSETAGNAQLIDFIEGVSSSVCKDYPDIKVDISGGPAVAVGNATRIKKDSILAVSLSLLMIFLLLTYSFHSLRNILLIFISVGWGLMFALGGMSLFRDNVSLIVIGIASVILGIAVNYPLHLISHTAHQPDRKQALKEILSPLVVGNITTVGAFLALVPLNSKALRELGIFASLLLTGTIIFVIIYLPHYICAGEKGKREKHIFTKLSEFSPENHRWIIAATLAITSILFFFSFRTNFDSSLSQINYMSDRQRDEMQYFEDLLTNDSEHKAQSLYIYGKGANEEEAIYDIRNRKALIDSLENCGMIGRQNDALSFISTKEEQEERLTLWNNFVEKHRSLLTSNFQKEAAKAGFAPAAFDIYLNLIRNSTDLRPQNAAFFSPLFKTVFSRNICFTDGGKSCFIVYPVNVEAGNTGKVKAILGDKCFAIADINRKITGSLSDNFNYIGLACSLIVFLFLWFSFGRIELALISFIPMVVSWIWILGLMAIMGIKFNIVNIILATFIFGQGDDYTIFVTEGCQNEYAKRKPILKSFKISILQSAAIMFAGIGTLIVAKHPALHSLAEVTIVGMFSVVLMAYLIPPLLFKLITTKGGKERRHPLTLKTIFAGYPGDNISIVRGRYIYKGKEIEKSVKRNLESRAEEIMNREADGESPLYFTDDGYGELAILLALSHPGIKIIARVEDDERRRIAEIAAKGLVDTIEFQS